MAKRTATHKKITKEPSEERRFEVLLEEIRGELKLVSEAYTASVERDQKLGAKIDQLGGEFDTKMGLLGTRIDRMHHEFFDFVSKVHGELSGQIHEVETRLRQEIQEVEAHLIKEIQEVKEVLIVHDKRLSALEQV